MLRGARYTAGNPELATDAAVSSERLAIYNAASVAFAAERNALLSGIVGYVGCGAAVRSPFPCNSGYNIHPDDGAFLDFGCIVLDVVSVHIGLGTQVGPGVQILTADHPRDPANRAKQLEFGRPVIVGRDVWIGAGALILPGVTVENDGLSVPTASSRTMSLSAPP